MKIRATITIKEDGDINDIEDPDLYLSYCRDSIKTMLEDNDHEVEIVSIEWEDE